MPRRFGRVFGYAVMLWIIGFIWGVFVFTVPAFKAIQSIPYVSKYPAISVVLLIAYVALVFYMAKTYLRATRDKIKESLEFGVTLLVINLVLDIIVYLVLFQSMDYFAYFSIWLSYSLFILIPWVIGRRLQNQR